jgi:type II secretory ATPase GspE/PulE/Tfp pilus assembly ATPase PilB-like protein
MNDLQRVEIDEGVDSLPPEEAVSALLDQASRMGASDLFFFAGESKCDVAVRHLGVLRPLATYPKDVGKKFIGLIKANAEMDVAERRRPLDGRWIREHGDGSHTDLRINTIPTLWGEDCTLRLLERESTRHSIESLGMLLHQKNEVLNLLQSPSGLILVTGPTGSGKTTSLYAALQYLVDGVKKINTIEDPVEYAMDGVRQSQVNPRIDLGFPELLTAILRQAPDVIMIGEVRDPKTAQAAVRAANSGHLVFATLHAPVAAGAIDSMLALEVSRHFLASSLLGILAQRLVRVLCDNCRTKVDISLSPFTFEDVDAHIDASEGQFVYAPGKCETCFQSGYTSRKGVFEILPVDRRIREMITNGDATHAVSDYARSEGMLDFRKSALINVARGVTSIEEVLRSVPVEYLGLD